MAIMENMSLRSLKFEGIRWLFGGFIQRVFGDFTEENTCFQTVMDFETYLR